MGHLYDITTKLALDLIFWLPSKLVDHYLQPLIDTWEEVAVNTEQAIKEYAEEHGL